MPSRGVEMTDVDADGEDVDADAHMFHCLFHRLVYMAGGPVLQPCYLVPGCFYLRLVMIDDDVDDKWKMARNYCAMYGRVWKKVPAALLVVDVIIVPHLHRLQLKESLRSLR